MVRIPFLSSSTRTLFVGFCPVVKSVYQSSTRAVDTYLHRGGASSFFFFFKEKKEALHHQVSDERHPFHGREIRYYARKYVTSGL